ncbi:MAG: hypothetical protein M3P51_12630 [Chloroflexota bacterium]|nr:hypothetical protein [Chloroflexota bacterium]
MRRTQRCPRSCKNERTAALFLDSILGNDEYKKLVKAKERAELDHFDARAEVDHLQLTMQLLRAVNPQPEEPHP